ncbi:unnamed protein product [Mytilus edulis]|uniref:Uncharacterized protein n=1 Tax=Mytilus edulis TaxID=6550 RepID=A0A8S3PM45_MYTED|nr:unnamed protein product [Mytilus edulis]
MREPEGAILAIENSSDSSIHKVAAPTETTLASDEEAQENWDSTLDSEADATVVDGASDEKIVTVCPQYQDSTCPTPVVDGKMIENTKKEIDRKVKGSSTGAIDRKATTENNSPINKGTVISVESLCDKESASVNPENLSLSLGSLFKADTVGTRYCNLQTPAVDSGTTVLRVTIATVRWGPDRRQWDPVIPVLKGIKPIQVKKENEGGSAQYPWSNKDLLPLSVKGLVNLMESESWCMIQRRTIHRCLGSHFVENPLY